MIRILDILGFLVKNLSKILTKKSKNLQDLARSCQEIQEILKFLSRVLRKFMDDHGRKDLTLIYFGKSNDQGWDFRCYKIAKKGTKKVLKK